MRGWKSLLCGGMVLVLSELVGPAHAYLDPGTGSMVIQAVVAGVVGALALGRLYWTRLKSLTRRKSAKEDDGK
jgi:hypothetical protein